MNNNIGIKMGPKKIQECKYTHWKGKYNRDYMSSMAVKLVESHDSSPWTWPGRVMGLDLSCCVREPDGQPLRQPLSKVRHTPSMPEHFLHMFHLIPVTTQGGIVIIAIPLMWWQSVRALGKASGPDHTTDPEDLVPLIPMTPFTLLLDSDAAVFSRPQTPNEKFSEYLFTF